MNECKIESVTNRIEYLDIFRSFGIILMIMGHIGYGKNFGHFIHAFHMPMFFFVSGFLYKKNTKELFSLAEYSKKKAKSLLVPYIIFGLFHYCIWLTTHDFSLEPLFHLIFVNTFDLPIAGGLWFLTALFITEILFFVIDKYIQNMPIKILIIVAVALLGNITEVILPVTFPYAIGCSFVGLGLYYIGYIIEQFERKIESIGNSVIELPLKYNIILSIVTTFFIFMNGYINMRMGYYANIFLFWLNALFSIVVGLNFAKLFYDKIKGTAISKWLMSIGKNSIIYVCLNEIVLLSLDKILEKMHLSWIFYKLAMLCITLFILLLISEVILKSKLKVVIGKK